MVRVGLHEGDLRKQALHGTRGRACQKENGCCKGPGVGASGLFREEKGESVAR